MNNLFVKMLAERAWNAALEHSKDDDALDLRSPETTYFNEWWEREVINPPEQWDDHHD